MAQSYLPVQARKDFHRELAPYVHPSVLARILRPLKRDHRRRIRHDCRKFAE